MTLAFLRIDMQQWPPPSKASKICSRPLKVTRDCHFLNSTGDMKVFLVFFFISKETSHK